MKALRVLVVEDEAIVAMMIEDMVADLGHEVVATAGRVDCAVKLAMELPIDLAILDVNLNGEETYPVAEVLVAHNVAIIFATGYGISGVKQEWRHRPVLQKPFDDNQLARVIAELEIYSASP